MRHMCDLTIQEYDYDEWDRQCAIMVDKLLVDDEGAGPKNVSDKHNSSIPGKSLLDQMVKACMEKLTQQKDGTIRKSELGVFLRVKIGKQYQRGWLRVVIQDMQTKGLVRASASTVFKIPVRPRPKVCHFSQQCKYLKHVEANKEHFKLFVHLCPQDQACPFLRDHCNGKPLTKEALEHFQIWKHKCLQGPRCELLYNHSLDHLLVYTHKF